MASAAVATAVLACCRHCARPRSIRRRGLCYGCHQDRRVREQYPSTSIMANRGSGQAIVKVKSAAEIELALRPCRLSRDDPQRIEVLMLRAKYKIPQYCYGDRRIEDDDIPVVDEDDLLF